MNSLFLLYFCTIAAASHVTCFQRKTSGWRKTDRAVSQGCWIFSGKAHHGRNLGGHTFCHIRWHCWTRSMLLLIRKKITENCAWPLNIFLLFPIHRSFIRFIRLPNRLSVKLLFCQLNIRSYSQAYELRPEDFCCSDLRVMAKHYSPEEWPLLAKWLSSTSALPVSPRNTWARVKN